ncbi:DUF4383 domain-containing protein [Candidatus Pacearchaeota archaeon]|nr:DUF4383 domain-containing protein [Candidatus Pacearchaeota archaeon]
MGAQKTWAWIIGIVLVLTGLLGFVNDPVLGIFNVNGLHNTVHILTGLVFIWGAWGGFARPVNKSVGVIYILLALLGFFVPLTFLDLSAGADPDNFLHLGVGIISALVGWMAD